MYMGHQARHTPSWPGWPTYPTQNRGPAHTGQGMGMSSLANPEPQTTLSANLGGA